MSPSLLLSRDSDIVGIKKEKSTPILSLHNLQNFSDATKTLVKNSSFMEHGNVVTIGLTSHLRSYEEDQKEHGQFIQPIELILKK